jgi:hypothetical protein
MSTQLDTSYLRFLELPVMVPGLWSPVIERFLPRILCCFRLVLCLGPRLPMVEPATSIIGHMTWAPSHSWAGWNQDILGNSCFILGYNACTNTTLVRQDRVLKTKTLARDQHSFRAFQIVQKGLTSSHCTCAGWSSAVARTAPGQVAAGNLNKGREQHEICTKAGSSRKSEQRQVAAGHFCTKAGSSRKSVQRQRTVGSLNRDN